MKYPEFEVLKYYQHTREPLAEKYCRRANEKDRGWIIRQAGSRWLFFEKPRKLFYSALALDYIVGVEFPKHIIRDAAAHAGFQPLAALDRRAHRAQVAGILYDSFNNIAEKLEAVGQHADLRRTQIIQSLNQVFRLLQSDSFVAQPDKGWSASKILKPMAIAAVSKVINLLLNSPEFRDIFDNTTSFDRTAIKQFCNGLSQGSITDKSLGSLLEEKIKTAEEKFDESKKEILEVAETISLASQLTDNQNKPSYLKGLPKEIWANIVSFAGRSDAHPQGVETSTEIADEYFFPSKKL